ncbi:hypothetical protein MTX20_08710 [Bradyrhizobium sp. ISRA435]|nr:hypothetical protein MTX20_08710 [Bradyrhizobium sp. ISRA435]
MTSSASNMPCFGERWMVSPPQRRAGAEADGGKPFQAELAETGVERIAQHLALGPEQIGVGDDIGATEQPRHPARRADVGEVQVVGEVDPGEIVVDRFGARDVLGADVALQHRGAGRADGSADLVHEGRPTRRIENQLSEARGHIVKLAQVDQGAPSDRCQNPSFRQSNLPRVYTHGTVLKKTGAAELASKIDAANVAAARYPGSPAQRDRGHADARPRSAIAVDPAQRSGCLTILV